MSSWKLTLPCTRAEAEAITVGDGPAAIDPVPTLMTSERVTDDPAAWQLDAYFESKPNRAAIEAVRALAPSAASVREVLERLRDADWVTLSQAGIAPVCAGRFYVHTATNAGAVPAGTRAFRIEAGLAFGTGTHETTTGCLMTLDAMKARGALVRNLIDLGTGTGLLAFAALHLWPAAFAIASDIDPLAVAVARDNAAANGVRLGDARGRLTLTAAAGLDDRAIIGRAPYDLVIANILAAPLIDLAPAIAAALAPGGTLVLAGLLGSQAEAVTRAYRRYGLRPAGRIDRGDWPTLRLFKRARWRGPGFRA